MGISLIRSGIGYERMVAYGTSGNRLCFGNRFHDEKRVLLGLSSAVIVIFFLVYTASALAAGGKLFHAVIGVDYKVALSLARSGNRNLFFISGILFKSGSYYHCKSLHKGTGRRNSSGICRCCR